VILVDSGPLIAAGLVNDDHHQVCAELLDAATEELLVPATVTAEVCYLLGSRYRVLVETGLRALTFEALPWRPCTGSARGPRREVGR
jgi:predicted nucleic acid-binding protein